MTLFQESANIFCKGPSTSFWSCWSMKSLKRDYEGLWRLNSEVIVGKWPWTVQHLRGVAVFLAALFPEIEEGRIWLKGCCLTALKSNGSPIVVSKIETLERSGDGMWKPLIQGGSVGSPYTVNTPHTHQWYLFAVFLPPYSRTEQVSLNTWPPSSPFVRAEIRYWKDLETEEAKINKEGTALEMTGAMY